MPSTKPRKLKQTLSGKVALVTGGSRGIGRAVALRLAGLGCQVVIAGRDAKSLTKTERELRRLGGRILSQVCDVRTPESVDSLFRTIRQEFKRLDIVVNNAGIGHANLPVSDLPFPVWKNVLETNLDGTFLVSQAALVLLKRGGTIVNNLSIAANRVFAGSAAYNASKHGALGLTNTLREELRPKGIRVIGILPGATDTDIWNSLWPKAPRRKMLAADTVADVIVNSILLPPQATVENLEILPTSGTL